ncbi:MAG: hypothetical protein HGA93_00975, partial [Methanothrix sp.]|nr:hypothetical protein [Methanothrix sp.]
LLTFMSAPAPSIIAFDASPNIISIGENSILKWSVTGDGATVTIEPGIGTVGLSGTREIAPIITTNYTLTAKNKDQEKIALVQLIVRKKNEGNQVTDDVVGGIATKSNVSMPLDVKAEPDQKQNEIEETIPAASEPGNPDESAIVPVSDSQQDAIAQPAQTVAGASNPTKSTAIDQSGMRQNAIVAPVSAIVPDTAAKHDSLSELALPKATMPGSNMSESTAHVESDRTESRTIDETPATTTYHNESDSADSRLGIDSDDGSVTEPKAAKVITAADWNSLNNVSRSENEFPSNAPIYAKLGGTSHTPAKSPDSQDPEVFDSGVASSDYLSADIQSQGSSRAEIQLSGASGPETLSPDVIPEEIPAQ